MLFMWIFLVVVCDLSTLCVPITFRVTSLELAQAHDRTRVIETTSEDMGNIDPHVATTKHDKSRACVR